MTNSISPVSSSASHTSYQTFSRWGLRAIVLLGLGVAAYALSRRYTSQAAPPPPLSKRFFETLFPNHHLHPVTYSQHAAGIFRIDADHFKVKDPQADVEITCCRAGESTTCSRQKMTFNIQDNCWEALVPDMPMGEEFHIAVHHKKSYTEGSSISYNVLAKEPFGVYELRKERKVEAHSQASVNRFRADANVRIAHDPLSITLNDFEITSTPGLEVSEIKAQTSRIHILFFSIVAPDLPNSNGNFIVSVILLPNSTKQLPPDFFRESWETAFSQAQQFTAQKPHISSDIPLKIHMIYDTIAS